MRSTLMLSVLLAGALAATAGAARPADKNAKRQPPPLPASVDGLPIGAIPRQELPTGTCAAFLWTRGAEPALVAMLTANPGRLRYAPGGQVVDLDRVAAPADAKLGLGGTSRFTDGTRTVTADLTIDETPTIRDGAAIPAGTLTLSQVDGDTTVVPVAGLVGCG